ncbi:RimK/LysX family protein [Endozoicomonas atrinae]|uniref:putative ATP-dependent zinc protease n=1 Tax=Endozoicomonas atrinae TaxID=1333660 RepID=UPI000A5E46F1|nr:RimK/LysX family protein [Endozoicomonas atrinae]
MPYSPRCRFTGAILFFSLALMPLELLADNVLQYCRIGDRYLFGHQENVTRIDHQFDTQLTALIDSGSTTSSMDARGITIKKMNNGSLWVQFNILTTRGENSREVTLLKPIKRYILVQTHSGKPQKRPVIEATIELGNVKTTTEFSLTSRSRFPQSILLGRNTLDSLAVIDTSQKYLLNGCEPDGDIALRH